MRGRDETGVPVGEQCLRLFRSDRGQDLLHAAFEVRAEALAELERS